MARHLGQGLTSGRKLLLGGAAALAIAIPLASGITACASRAGTPGAEASSGGLPSFETASIKRDELRTPLVAGRLLPGMPLEGVNLSGSNFIATTIVTAMIMDAYGQYMKPLNPTQVVGGPAWIRTDFYQISAKVNDSIVNGEWKKLPYDKQWDQAMLMLRSLLINRFKLRVKHETKVLPVFELVLAKNGPKVAATDQAAERPCRITDVGPGKGLWLNVKSCDFRTLVGILSLGPELRSRVLVDKTGLHGRYSFKLHLTREIPPEMRMPARGSQGKHNEAPPEPPGLLVSAALREELGLKVQSATAPVDTIIIQRIENPARN